MPAPDERYEVFKQIDPYPDIPPALLHSGHLASYAVATGMIEPFEVDNLIKPATYLVPLEGEVRFRNEVGELQSFYISSNKLVSGQDDIRARFTLQPNSLCYVTLEPTFRIPAYLAGRFNLKIRDVYRGLLVGTGPLVDPGFTGTLYIPLHNFTSNAYTLTAGEGFVYFECTKLSALVDRSTFRPAWLPTAVEHQPPFPKSKNKRRALDDYIHEATQSGPAQYALMSEVNSLQNTTRKAVNRVRQIALGAILGAIIFVITVVGVADTGFALYFSSNQFDQSAQSSLSDSIAREHEHLSKLQATVDDLRRELATKKLLRTGPSGQ